MLDGTIFDNEHNEYAVHQVRYHAGRLTQMFGLGRNGYEFFEQDLASDLSQALDRYDDRQAHLRTFISRVVKRRCMALIREVEYRQAEETSLEDLPSTVVDEDMRFRMLGYTRPDPTEQVDLAEAVSVAVSRLPQELREVATLLMHHNQIEVARRLGVNSTTIHRARREICEHFARAGLADFL